VLLGIYANLGRKFYIQILVINNANRFSIVVFVNVDFTALRIGKAAYPFQIIAVP
jgi:hypothetical protein